jgi:hypothetical protein
MRLQRSIVRILGSRKSNFFYPSKKPKRGIGLKFLLLPVQLHDVCYKAELRNPYEASLRDAKIHLFIFYSVRSNPTTAGRRNISPILIQSADLGQF